MHERSDLLSAEEEAILLGRYFDRADQEALTKLWLAHDPLARRAASHFARQGPCPAEELLQEARAAIGAAIPRFDRSKTVRLSAYLSPCVIFALTDYRRRSALVTIGRKAAGSAAAGERQREGARALSYLDCDAFENGSRMPEALISTGEQEAIGQRIGFERLYSEVVGLVHEIYSRRDLDIVLHYVDGTLGEIGIGEVARKSNLSVDRVRRIIAEARHHILDLFKERMEIDRLGF